MEKNADAVDQNTPISSHFDSFISEQIDVSDLDTELWDTVLDALEKNGENLNSLPLSVRLFYASRSLEWEVANGGFSQAAFNIPELFPLAREWYSGVGIKDAADLIACAEQFIRDGEAEFKTTCNGDIGGLFEEFLESKLSTLDPLAWSSGLDGTDRRVEYAVEHRSDFEGLLS